MLPLHRKPTALIVDEDVALIFWLGEIFGKSGWNLVPAMNCQQAISLAVMWDLHFDLVVVNPALSGAIGMIETLNRVHRPKVIAIGGFYEDPALAADASIDRPDLETSASRAEWTRRFRRVLRKAGLDFELEPDGSTRL